MPKFVIEREIPGAGKLSAKELQATVREHAQKGGFGGGVEIDTYRGGLEGETRRTPVGAIQSAAAGARSPDRWPRCDADVSF